MKKRCTRPPTTNPARGISRFTAIVLCVVLAGLTSAVRAASDQGEIDTRIEFRAPQASAVMLVWGINGWQIPDGGSIPAGTREHRATLHTPMERTGENFSATLALPNGTVLDFGFLITEPTPNGTVTERWEASTTGDFHQKIDRPRTLSLGPPAPADPNTIRIRLHAAGVGRVDLVWGVEGWSRVPPELPQHTVVNSTVLRTPMRAEKPGVFALDLDLPAGTPVSFGFRVHSTSEGIPASQWVIHGTSDYHAVVGSVDRVDIVRHDLHPEPIPPTQLQRMGWITALIATLLLIGAKWREKARRITPQPLDPFVRWVAITLALVALLAIARVEAMGVVWGTFPLSPWVIGRIFSGAYNDFIYALVLAAAFLVPAMSARPRFLSTAALTVFRIIAAISVLACAFNIDVLTKLNGPLTWQWLYYSEFLMSPEAKSAIAAGSSVGPLLDVVCYVIALFLVERVVHTALRWPVRPSLGRVLGVGALAGVVAFLPLAAPRVEKLSVAHSRLTNPIVAFVASIVRNDFGFALYTMEVPEELSRFPHIATPPETNLPAKPVNDGTVRNVIFFVLESVAAEYTDPYGAKTGMTPVMQSLLPEAALVTDAYAHTPATAKSFFSMTTGLYPYLSYHSMSAKRPDLPVPTLPGQLRKAGYQTTFITTANAAYQRMDEFARHAGFDSVHDYGTIACKTEADAMPSEELLETAPTECMDRPFLDWLDARDAERPFFMVLWPAATHYPYIVGRTAERPTPPADDFQRYLLSLQESDALLGRVVETLEARGLRDSTLIVVIGDHGEAFGRHGDHGHGAAIHEANVRIPFLLINRKLFHGERLNTVRGMVDVAPTTLSLLGLDIPETWQGTSVYDPSAPARTYLFCPWGSFYFGCRFGPTKFIYDAKAGSYEVYNIENDPLEMFNLAKQRPDLVDAGMTHIAAWVQHHRRVMDDILAK